MMVPNERSDRELSACSTDRVASWTIGRLLRWLESAFAERGFETPRLDAEVLLAHALGCRRIELYTRFDEEASEEARDRLRPLARRRLDGCPVAYLVGIKEFFSLEFEVSPDVLIPRPDTETLVTEALQRVQKMDSPAVLDMGTGSGNIAIALARHCQTAQVVAVDISGAALEVARRNAERLGVAERIEFIESDLFASVPQDRRFDLIVSNPPYVATEEWDGLDRGIRDFEPRIAVDAGPGGFGVIERLIAGACRFLKTGGTLLVEVGERQAQAVAQRFEQHPSYVAVATIRDGGDRPRAVVGRLQHGNVLR